MNSDLSRAERTPPALRATSPFRGGIWANLPGVSGAERPDLSGKSEGNVLKGDLSPFKRAIARDKSEFLEVFE